MTLLRSGLSSSTRAYVKNCYNIITRAVVTTIACAFLLGLSLLLNRLIDFSLRQFGASEGTQNIVTFIATSYLVGMAAIILLLGIVDLFSLLLSSLRAMGGKREGQSDEADN